MSAIPHSHLVLRMLTLTSDICLHRRAGCWCWLAGDTLKLMHCVPSLPPGRLVAVPGAGLLRVPHVDPALLAEKAAAEADSSLSTKLMSHVNQAGVSFLAAEGFPQGRREHTAGIACRITCQAGVFAHFVAMSHA